MKSEPISLSTRSPRVDREAAVARSAMFVPAVPALGLGDFLRPNGDNELIFPLNAPGAVYFYAARSGIYHLMRALGCRNGETVLMPDYHSGVEVWAVRTAGIRVRYYHIRRDLTPDLDELRDLSRSGCRVLYVIHYFGWPQPMGELKELCRERGMLLIEDCALSMLSRVDGQPLGAFGDYSVFCLYKTLPVPNGGLLIQNGNPAVESTGLGLTRSDRLSTLARVSELMLVRMRTRSEIGGKALLAAKTGVGKLLTSLGIRRMPVGDISPDFHSEGYKVENLNLGMSPVSKSLLKRFDYPSIYRRRRENFLHLLERLQSEAAFSRKLEEGVCPLFFPLLVAEKSAAARALYERGIEATQLWNYGYPEARAETGPDAQFLRDHLLELPIHQDITAEQTDYLAEQVLKLGLCI